METEGKGRWKPFIGTTLGKWPGSLTRRILASEASKAIHRESPLPQEWGLREAVPGTRLFSVHTEPAGAPSVCDLPSPGGWLGADCPEHYIYTRFPTLCQRRSLKRGD